MASVRHRVAEYRTEEDLREAIRFAEVLIDYSSGEYAKRQARRHLEHLQRALLRRVRRSS